MANKSFEIQSSTLTIGGVDLQAGNTGVVIPGVTQATNYKVEEVNDTGDQTYQFAPDTEIVVIDAALYATIVAQGNESGWADFTVTTDDEGYIDEIQVNGQGTYSQSNAGIASSNDMYAYVGAGSASDRPLVPQDWIQIPFRPKMRAGDIENIGGGSSNQILNGGETFTIDGSGNVKFDGNGNGGVDRGLVWQYGDNNGGINSMVRQDGGGLTVRAYTTDGGGGPTGQSEESGYSAPVNIVTNQDANQKTWTFDGAGNLTFPDGSIQTTAYTGTNTNRVYYLNDYGGIETITEPTQIIIDGMSYEGGNIVSDGAFGPGSSRVTLYADSMFAMIAVNSTATDVYYNGEMGADGDGQKIKTDLLVENYRGYYASSCLYSNTGDPCISQIVISKGSNPLTDFHQNAGDTNVDDFHVSGLGSGTVVVLNVYWDSQSDPFNASVQLAAQTFIDTVIFDGGTERTDLALMALAFLAGSAAIRSTIENYQGNLLYSNFEFYEGEQVVRPTGGTGTGFVALVSASSGGNYSDEFVIKPGTGYTENDTLTVAGSEFGGVSPDNDVTITINGVDGTGSVTSWSVNGTVPSQVWPGSFIIDGNDDQYDTGNFIGTNFTRVTAMVTVETVTLESNDLTKMTVLASDKDISPGQFAFFNGQNRGDYVVYADSYGINNTAEYFDANTGYTSTQSLTYDFAVDVDNAHVTANGNGSWSVGSNNLSTKIYSIDEIDPEHRDVVIMAGSQNNNWLFRRDGILELPSGGDITLNGTSVLGSGGAQLVGDGYDAGTGVKRVVYTDWQGYQGGESNGILVLASDVAGIQNGDTITFRNGEVRTITSFDTSYDPQVYVQWDSSVDGSWDNPRLPMTFTSYNYTPETKKTARIKPDLDTEGSGQFMDVYVGGSMVVDNKHVHMAGHSADTELFLGTDNNFVSSKDAGLSPARVNLKSENDITVSDTNLRMSRGSTWLSVYGDGQNRNSHGNTYDLTWNVVESDDQGNFYVGGESCAYAEAMVAKYGPDGDLIWSKLVNGDTLNGWEVDGVAYNPVDKEVAIAVQTNASRNHNYYKINVLDSETGDFKSVFDLYDADGDVTIHNMTWHPTLSWIAVGYTHGEKGTSESITAVGATGTNIIELPVNSVKVGGQWPDRNSGTWSISGTGITGDQVLQGPGVGLYQNVPVINLTNPSDTGMTVGMRVDYQYNYYDYVTTNTPGTGVWAYNDQFKILGSNLGGIDGGTNVSASPSSMTAAGGDAYAFFSKYDYPNLYSQIAACSWTAQFNTNTYTVSSIVDNGGYWAVYLQNCTDLTPTSILFYTAQGNDILGNVADLNGIQYGYTGVPNRVGRYRIDMGYSMGYNGTDFSGGTFTITAVLDNRAFVWNHGGPAGWNKIYKPMDATSTSTATCVTVHKLSGDIIVGGRDSSNSGKGFVWKINSSGNTVWVKGLDNDSDQVCSVAVSEVNGNIYYTTSYNSVNKLNPGGELIKRVEPNGMWGMSNPIVKLEQGLDGAEHLYVAGQFGAIWTSNSGFMVTKLSSDLRVMWTREFWGESRNLSEEYDIFHNNVALGRDKIVLVGYTYVGSFNNANAYLASISTGDTFEPGQIGNWHLDIPGGDIQYNDQTNNYTVYDFTSNGGSVTDSSLLLADDNGSHDWTNWSWKSTTLRLDNDKGIKGVESIHFAEGGKLDHNPADIPPVLTDFNQDGWNYTLKLSDRGKFIVNEPVPNGGNCNHLYITVPSNVNVNFPVGTVITLINTNDVGNNGYRIYVQPEYYYENNAQAPKIWAAGSGNQNPSTWSFQGMQTATLMKIGSNEWMLTCNNPSNED